MKLISDCKLFRCRNADKPVICKPVLIALVERFDYIAFRAKLADARCTPRSKAAA